jgi:hypothetical protein
MRPLRRVPPWLPPVVVLATLALWPLAKAWPWLTYAPRAGDVVFQSLPHGPLVDAIEGVTRSPASHCGVVVATEQGWMVAETLGTVHRTPLGAWCRRGRGWAFEVRRLADPSSAAALAAATDRWLGRPYDARYRFDDDAIYCSELVLLAGRADLGRELGRIERLGDLDWRPWAAAIEGFEGGQVPLDREMLTPEALRRDPGLVRVHGGLGEKTVMGKQNGDDPRSVARDRRGALGSKHHERQE